MSFKNEINSIPCPNCDTGKIMTGRHAKYNAKIDGKAVCIECKMQSLLNDHLNRKD